ncbi:MAG: acyltransferase [Gammaproteobacteria bacterium]|nr:acyltransferase [Gammaproteobacteria bacterium]
MTHRRHDIDVLRTLAFAVLILYHVAMVYVADWGFHIKSEHQWAWLEWPMVGVNRWRMPLIFMLSGIAIGFALGKPDSGGWTFASRRTQRLLLPLGFGMLAIVPIQAYCEAVSNGAVEPGFAAFMFRYLQFRPWPEGSFTGASHGVTWNHLWYLAYLWVYTLLLLCLRPMGSWAARHAAAWLPARTATALLLTLPALYFFATLHWIEPAFPETHALLDDPYAHAKYFAMFLLGFGLSRSEVLWQALDQLRWQVFAIALLALSSFLALRLASGFESDFNGLALANAAQGTYLWFAVLTILAFARRWLNRPFRWLPYANEAVYPWYILHQSLIVPLVFVLMPLGLSGPAEAGLVLAGTVVGCGLAHHLLIRRIRVLRLLFGLDPSPRDGVPSSSNPVSQQASYPPTTDPQPGRTRS